MAKPSTTSQFKSWQFPLIALLAWLIPGAGHFYLGLKKRALLLFIGIETTFLIGVYIATVRIVDPAQSAFWFLAQILAGLNTILANVFANAFCDQAPGQASLLIRDHSFYIGVLYTSVAGLLNVLALLDALIRAGRASLGQEPSSAD